MPSGIASFVHDLAHTGCVRLPGGEGPPDRGFELGVELTEMDARARAHAPGTAPDLDRAAATWAAERLYQLCYALKNPEGPEDGEDPVPHPALATPAPFTPDPDRIWSVHLFFRCLPDLQRLAGPRDPADPWREALERHFVAWPLAPIQTEATPDPRAVAHILDHPSLRRIYADLRTKPR